MPAAPIPDAENLTTTGSPPALAALPRRVEVQTREIVLHGHRISYRIAGEGPVVLLVHGITGNAQTWTGVQERLGAHYTTIAPDLPGHGVSDKPVGDYSLGNLASALRDLLVALGHERATLVGHSLGGGVAMQFAYQFPERTERLILVSSGGLGEDVNLILRAACLPGADLFLATVVAPIAAAGSSVGRALGRLGWRPAPDLQEVASGFASLADTATRMAFLHTLRSVVGTTGQRINATNRLYLAADMPTLLLWGEKDPIIPARHAREAHELMPGSRIVTFARCGSHAPPRRARGLHRRAPGLHRADRARRVRARAAAAAAARRRGRAGRRTRVGPGLRNVHDAVGAQPTARLAGQPTVAGHQYRVAERFGERKVGGVVGGQVMAQLPDPLAQRRVRVPDEAQVRQVGDGSGSPMLLEFAREHEPAQGAQGLGLHQLGGVQHLLLAVQCALNRIEGRCTSEEEVGERRGVENDHRWSRSARMTAALDGPS